MSTHQQPTAAQTAALDTLTADHGQPYWPTMAVRPNGILDVTMRAGSGFVITPSGAIRPA